MRRQHIINKAIRQSDVDSRPNIILPHENDDTLQVQKIYVITSCDNRIARLLFLHYIKHKPNSYGNTGYAHLSGKYLRGAAERIYDTKLYASLALLARHPAGLRSKSFAVTLRLLYAKDFCHRDGFRYSVKQPNSMKNMARPDR